MSLLRTRVYPVICGQGLVECFCFLINRLGEQAGAAGVRVFPL